MTGLIWKDVLVMRKNIRFYAIFLLAYFGLALLGVFDVDLRDLLFHRHYYDAARLLLLL